MPIEKSDSGCQSLWPTGRPQSRVNTEHPPLPLGVSRTPLSQRRDRCDDVANDEETRFFSSFLGREKSVDSEAGSYLRLFPGTRMDTCFCLSFDNKEGKKESFFRSLNVVISGALKHGKTAWTKIVCCLSYKSYKSKIFV